jgi:RNA polymerase sigma factor (sigma-70 family)
LYRIALNVAFSHRRRVRLRQMAERLLRPSLGRADARVVSSPLREALAKLPPREAAAVMLRHYHGYSRLETARILGLTERAVSLRVARAQAILLAELGEDWADGMQLHSLVGSRVTRTEDNSG